MACRPGAIRAPARPSRRDAKIDDQRPLTGSLRFTGTATFSHAGVSEATTLCMTAADTNEYDVAGDAQNCNLVFIY